MCIRVVQLKYEARSFFHYVCYNYRQPNCQPAMMLTRRYLIQLEHCKKLGARMKQT